MGDIAEMTDPQTDTDADGLARRIAVAGLQVSQAADELQLAAERLMAAEEQSREAETRLHAAEEQSREAEMRVRTAEEQSREAETRLLAAEEQSREAEMRVRTAEEQVAQGASKNAELLEMLRTAREGQTEADERCRRAEQSLLVTTERARLMEEQIEELETRAREAEAQPQVTVIVDDERTALQEAIAADVRRPLTSILGLTLALRHADPHSTEGTDMVRQLATNARKLDRLVGEILALDKIASGQFEPNLRRTDLEALVRRVVEESPDLANRDVKVAADHVAIKVDPALTEQMVETLLSNAGRRTAPGNPVWVRISSDQGGAVIAVDDTGPEVPPGLRGTMVAALGDEGPAARRETPRAATGLTLLARLAEIHDGRAWVEERPGGGASFRVFLPGTQEPQGESVDDRAAARVLDPDDERAVAFARALVGADEPQDGESKGLFDTTAVPTNGHHAGSIDEDIPGEITI